MTKRKRLPIGIDIGTESIKMLQFQVSPGHAPLVAAAAVWRFPPGASQDPAQRRQQAVEAVTSMLRHGGFRGRDVVSALSCSQVGIKNIRLPRMPPTELQAAIKWEATERFGFEVSDDQLNWIDAGEVRSGNDTVQELILLVAKQEAIDNHLAMLSAMKLTPVAIDAEPLAMFRVFGRFLRREEDEQTAKVLLDLGASGTRVLVARGRQIVFIKGLEVGGSALTAAVSGQFNLSEEDAAQFRLRAMRQESARVAAQGDDVGDALVDWNIQDAVRGTLESLAEELALCLRYCSVTFRGLRPAEVVLCGGEAYDPLVAKLLGERLGIPCVLGRPLRGADTDAVEWESHARDIFAEWAVCAGLALKTLDVWNVRSEVDDGRQDRLSA
ncbi:MAG: pilus assembly protein PilM [Phycisphaerae bacterium]|nr:pilus assembly protein PilM [Phycisphaerae bacterium]